VAILSVEIGGFFDTKERARRNSGVFDILVGRGISSDDVMRL